MCGRRTSGSHRRTQLSGKPGHRRQVSKLGRPILKLIQQIGDHSTITHRQFATHEVGGLNPVGSLVDCRDPNIPIVLGDTGLLHETHSPMDLKRERSHLITDVGAQTLGQGDQQVGEFLPGSRLIWVGCCIGAIKGGGIGVNEATHRIDPRSLRHQHPAHVGMVDNRARRVGRGTSSVALETILGVVQRLLVCPLAEAQPF